MRGGSSALPSERRIQLDSTEGPAVATSTGPLLALRIERGAPPGRQIEAQLRALIRDGGLVPGARLPSTRALAADLGLSRGVVVNVYAQLAAEGYLTLARGTVPTIADIPREAPHPNVAGRDVHVADARFNLRADLPDLGLFPRSDWLAAMRAALRSAQDVDLAYGDPFGSAELRNRLAPFLARTRGIVGGPERIGIHAGSTQAFFALGSVLREQGVRRIALEDPSHRWRRLPLGAAGLHVVPVPSDEDGLRVELLDDANVGAVLLSPDHGFPLGRSLSPTRRRALVDWAVRNDALVIEHDFDAHFRYDRTPTGALQALAPEHVAYVGTASALLAPTLRLGWTVLPARLCEPVGGVMSGNVFALPRIEQLALAEFIARGYLDRHLRRARSAYRGRRLLACRLLGVESVPSGLFLHLPLPAGTRESAVLATARSRGFALDGVQANALLPHAPGLVVGFAAAPEPTLREACLALNKYLL